MRQPNRIESITLRDIGVFEHTRFDFPPIESIDADNNKAEIHIFTGPNGCGKSTLLYALAGIFDMHGQYSLIRRRYRSDSSQVDFEFAGSSGKYGADVLNSNLSKTRLSGKPGHFFDYDGGWGSHLVENYQEEKLPSLKFDFAAFAYSGNRSAQSNFAISSIQEITASPFENALSFDQTVRPNVLAQWIANNRTKAALAKAENAYDEADSYDRALKRISQFIDEVCGIDATFRLKRSPLEVSLEIGGTSVSFDTLPEGLKSITCWVADLALRLEALPWQQERDIFSQPIILFLDEVDIHLHPKWQRRILPAIQKLLPNAQVFVSTHSPFVVGSVEDAWVYRLPEPRFDLCRDPHIPEIISAAPSSAGKSYQLILDEVFGVPEQFDVETEKQLDEFYQLRQQVMENRADDTKLKALAKTLAQKGEEIGAIVSMELRQLARLTKQN
ncbi:AAA family ATPase [Serratia fonticola]|uniref:AAA family ATPase n=1 Tax=Serratia fonticola TaxID=47917 RepID=UPI00192B63CF|nr:ATP-binding protein [Serratia fonticola]MBL5904580.1 AAA family ATPase [Serratia fonticola]